MCNTAYECFTLHISCTRTDYGPLVLRYINAYVCIEYVLRWCAPTGPLVFFVVFFKWKKKYLGYKLRLRVLSDKGLRIVSVLAVWGYYQVSPDPKVWDCSWRKRFYFCNKILLKEYRIYFASCHTCTPPFRSNDFYSDGQKSCTFLELAFKKHKRFFSK